MKPLRDISEAALVGRERPPSGGKVGTKTEDPRRRADALRGAPGTIVQERRRGTRESERRELLRLAEERARDLERALLKAFERELRWVTVTLGTVARVDEEGREVHDYSYGINLYDGIVGAPAYHVDVALHATDVEISDAVRKAIWRGTRSSG